MKKSLIAILTSLTILATGVTAAFAQDTPVIPAAPAAETQTLNLPEDPAGAANPDRQALKDRIQYLKELREQAKGLHQQLVSQTQTNKGLLSDIKSTVNREALEGIKEIRAANKEIRSNQIEPLISQIKDLRQQIQSAGSEEEKKALREQLKQLLEQLKPVRDQIKSNRQSFQGDLDELKAQREAVKEKISAAKPLWEAQKELRAQVKNLIQQKQSLWPTFRSQVQDKDYTGALATLNQIIGLKEQIIDLKQEILANKQQVTGVLQGAVGDGGTDGENDDEDLLDETDELS